MIRVSDDFKIVVGWYQGLKQTNGNGYILDNEKVIHSYPHAQVLNEG
jgi:hypothetical protein